MSKRTRARLAREKRKLLRATGAVRKLASKVAREWGDDTPMRAAQRVMPTKFANWEMDWNHAAHLQECIDRLQTLVSATLSGDSGGLFTVACDMMQEYRSQLRALEWGKESRVFTVPYCVSFNGERSDRVTVRRVREVPEGPFRAFGN